MILQFEQKKQLQQLHKDFIQEAQNQGLKPSKFSGKNFMPHISIGRIKAGSSHAVALGEIGALFNKLVANPYPFMVYDIHLDYTEAQQNKSLIKYDLPRRNIGVLKVDRSRGKPFVLVDTQAHATKLAKELKGFYNITSSAHPGQEKTVIKTKNAFALLLTQQEFEKVEGHYANLG